MIGLFLTLSARVDLRARAGDDFDGMSYTRAQGINPALLTAIGFFAVTGIQDCGSARFDFSDHPDEARQGFVMEALDADGETVVDLIAWPLDEPANVLTMFGQAGLASQKWRALLKERGAFHGKTTSPIWQGVRGGSHSAC